MLRILVLPAALLLAVETNAQDIQPRPGVVVTPFDYGTVESNLPRDMQDPGRRVMHDEVAMVARLIGVGVADLVVEKLVESERFRVFERRQLDAVRQEQQLDPGADEPLDPARYIVTGSVTWLGVATKNYGGMAGGGPLRSGGRLGVFGLLTAASVKHSTTSVHVTVRVVDTRTGEVISSFTSQGQSKKRWDVGAIHLGSGGVAGGKVADTQFRETAIGEASTRVASDIAERMIALRATRLR